MLIGCWSTRKLFNLYVTILRVSLKLRYPKQENNNILRQFIGIANYHRNVWFRRSEILARIYWLPSHQTRSRLNGTNPINRPLKKSRKSLGLKYWAILCYLDFSKPFPFHLYIDASDHQLGAVIMQNKKPIAFHSWKLNKAQRGIKSVKETESCYQILKPLKNTRISCFVTPP
jgi:hypothetical protein